MAGYSQNDVNSMRQDAIRRVQEMQRRSQGYVNSANRNRPQEKPVSAPEKPAEKKPEKSSPKPEQTSRTNQQFRSNQNGFGGNPFQAFVGQPQQSNPRKPSSEKPCEPPKSCGEPVRCEEKPEPPKMKGPLSGILESILPGVNLDQDKIIIILLIILLSREGADIKLLLALGYLMI